MTRTVGCAVALCLVAGLGCQMDTSGLSRVPGVGADLAGAAASVPYEIEIEAIPAGEAPFDTWFSKVDDTPQGAAAGFIAAAILLSQDAALGQRCLLKTVASDYLSGGGPNHSLKYGIGRFEERAGIARSYVRNTVPPDYALPDPPFTMTFYADAAGTDPGPGRRKIFVDCTGADSRRPITLLETAGGWRVAEASSLWVGVRK